MTIESVDWKTSPPAEVGSRVGFVARFLGRTLRYTYEFVESVAGQRLVMRTQGGPFPMETTYTWEATPNNSTRMTLRNRGADRVLEGDGADHETGDETRQPQGPGQIEGDPRGLT